jgi:hypothetical protein
MKSTACNVAPQRPVSRNRLRAYWGKLMSAKIATLK